MTRAPRTGRPAGRPPKIDWDRVPLGIDTDADIAVAYKVSRRAVAAQRHERNIPPAAKRSRLERDAYDIAALDRALTLLLDDAVVGVPADVEPAIACVPGWRVETRRSPPPARRVRAHRFLAAGSRTWTEWMNGTAARRFLKWRGWVTAAEMRLADLRRIDGDGDGAST